MRKNIGWIALVLVSVMVLSMFLGCGGSRSRFIGTWLEVDESGEETGEKLVLAKNGEGSISESGITGSVKWSVEKDSFFLTISICGMTETQECKYEFSGNKLILTKVEDGTTSTYIKQ